MHKKNMMVLMNNQKYGYVDEYLLNIGLYVYIIH